MGAISIKRALISVSDKTGIVELASELAELGVELLSTGGTYKLLSENHIAVTEVSEYTGFPEMMDGRVKTLHPKIHGGLLGRRDVDREVMQEQDIHDIDLVVVNLYPFERTVEAGADLATAIENIDIGGPAMIRSAAKNYPFVATLVDTTDYEAFLAELKQNKGSLSLDSRFSLAVRAFVRIAAYDAAIANHLSAVGFGSGLEVEHEPYPKSLNLQFSLSQQMRYGENPHQTAAFYVESSSPHAQETKEPGVSTATQLQGKALSYNNVADTDAAFECVRSFSDPACVIVKHANPCGVAVNSSLLTAYEKAFEADPTSAFGGIIAFNRELDAKTAAKIVENQFVEVIIAPSLDQAALSTLANKKNVRVLTCGSASTPLVQTLDYKRVTGGLLVQQKDLGRVSEDQLNIVTRRKPTDPEMKDLMFAWIVAKYVKSNAIVYVQDQRTVGVGAGQMSRVYSAIIAGMKARDEGLEVKGCVMASDAFFPFRDSIDSAAETGITAVIQPGGSVRDKEVIEAADEAGMAMVFTGMRHFRH